MSAVAMGLSVGFIPAVMSGILLYGLFKRLDIYASFIQGAKEGLMTAVEIIPYLVAVFIAIDLFKGSGALDLIQQLLAPVFQMAGVPEELLPMLVMKPVSGSGSLAILESLIQECGPDSYAARVGSVMLGSSETIFYTLAVYFGATAVKNGRHTLFAGMMAYFAATAAAVVLCRYM